MQILSYANVYLLWSLNRMQPSQMTKQELFFVIVVRKEESIMCVSAIVVNQMNYFDISLLKRQRFN